MQATDLVTIERPNPGAIEKTHVNRWRVFNGQDWVHGFDDKQKAIDFAKRNGGTRIAYCKKINDEVVYTKPERVVIDVVG